MPSRSLELLRFNGAYSHDVTAAILVFQNKETAAILVYQPIPPGKPKWSLIT